jgi:polyferredoxin
MLKLRRTQTRVSSTMLWEKILRDKQANTPWQKLKRNLLLLLQLLILAALVFALARPALRTRVVASGEVAGLLDAGSMWGVVVLVFMSMLLVVRVVCVVLFEVVD